ncbi:MAG TPA: DNA-binding protein WhiA [Candidatus Limnocylindrales bacterium]|nr:DNA-binding protein WhiA [Candidatus Limnocylindrales bacterium]
MTRPERDLVAALRAELAAIDPSRPCDRGAEAAGLAAGPTPREGPVARLALRLGRGSLDRDRDQLDRDRDQLDRDRDQDDVLAPRGLTALRAFDWAASPEHCRMAYLRGLFLARGSLSLASGRTHLEFVVPAADAPVLASQLDEEGLPAAWRVRRGRGVVTWKSADTVGLFLRRIGAGGALLELEARQVARALRGDLNRVLNAESANLQRAVGAAGRQIAAIDELDADGRLAQQPPFVRMVADARRDTPEATLGELAERLGVHRSTVQRALERIEHLALHPDEGIGRRTRRRPNAKARNALA